jgi:hypothetical protein
MKESTKILLGCLAAVVLTVAFAFFLGKAIDDEHDRQDRVRQDSQTKPQK